MTTTVLSQQGDLENVIAAAIWRRVTGEDGNWGDLWPVDREEFEEDAQAVLAALVAAGYKLPVRPLNLDGLAGAAVDTLAREAIYQLVLTDESLRWADFPNLAEQDRAAVVGRVRERAEAAKPARLALVDAYEYLTAKAEADSA